MIADSIIGAATELGPLKIPIVARLQGTNSAEGLRLVSFTQSRSLSLTYLMELQLEQANLGIHVEASFGEAAEKAVKLSKMD